MMWLIISLTRRVLSRAESVLSRFGPASRFEKSERSIRSLEDKGESKGKLVT